MPAGATYTQIATTTLGSAQSSVTFSSISGAYTDLVLVTSAKSATSDRELTIRFNSDSGSNYSNTYIYGDGSSAVSGRSSNSTTIDFARTDQNNFWAGLLHIQNYSNTTTNKTTLSRGNSGSYVFGWVGLWRSTAAITSLTIGVGGGQNFASGSEFSLYGIAAA